MNKETLKLGLSLGGLVLSIGLYLYSQKKTNERFEKACKQLLLDRKKKEMKES